MEDRQRIEQENEKQYWEVLKQLDPELFLIKLALEESGVNPRIIPRVIRGIANMGYGTGHGRISIYMTNKEITAVRIEENDRIDLNVFQ
jgi:hypothetical protein